MTVKICGNSKVKAKENIKKIGGLTKSTSFCMFDKSEESGTFSVTYTLDGLEVQLSNQ